MLKVVLNVVILLPPHQEEIVITSNIHNIIMHHRQVQHIAKVVVTMHKMSVDVGWQVVQIPENLDTIVVLVSMEGSTTSRLNVNILGVKSVLVLDIAVVQEPILLD